MSTIRDLGQHLCPRCLIPLSKVERIGMVQDMKQRQTLARINDANRQSKIQSARNWIYKENYAVDNERVESLLKDHSLVPTEVLFSLLIWWWFCANILLIECFLKKTWFSRSQHVSVVGYRYDA